MKIELEVNNKSRSPLRRKFLSEIVQKTLQEVGDDFWQRKIISLSLAVVEESEIQAINKKYRKINAVTDILSFAEYKSKKEFEKVKDKELFLGELILCYDDIKKYSQKNKLNFQEELVRVVSHGVLHLLGMKHGTKMFSIQNKVAKN
jgi:probable rRNA maturation factor